MSMVPIRPFDGHYTPGPAFNILPRDGDILSHGCTDPNCRVHVYQASGDTVGGISDCGTPFSAEDVVEIWGERHGE